MLTTAQYIDLQERVAKGKQVLENKWGSRDFETRQWIDLWFELSDLLFKEQCRRGVFKISKSHDEIMQSTEETLERVRQQMITKGYAKPQKKGGQKKDVRDKSESYHLFESS